ncbi:thioesterase family protein [Actinorugispora endophytica]|uniref:Thioesterase superfamily protein n=1 Tax=Actinorugispora endophytica TaxID=1605990 RepID=A0A4R6UG62_9ACTN|nr:thioesterase family protein [Actinorugispora endophytica]TDQ43895.1 thioesterase superfamily protein [Actinorugispora endophytica]
MTVFESATAVRPRGGTGAGAGEAFDVVLDPAWSVGGRPHGGYLLAVLGRAASAAAGGHPHLTAVSASFVEPPEPGDAVAEVEVLRAGRGATQMRARLLQEDRLKAECLVTQGLLEDRDAWWSEAAPVELPAERECFLAPSEVPELGLSAPLLGVVEHRLDPGLLGFAVGAPSGRGVVAGWQRLADGADWDPLSVLVALDVIPSASLDLGIAGWAPTVQFSAYVRRLPAPGPLRTRLRATEVGAGTMDLTAHAWDAKGRLVAQATQIAAVRIPDHPAPGGR